MSAISRPVKNPAWRKRLAVAGVVLISLLLHGLAVFQLPVDYDEPVYMETALDYAALMRADDLKGIIDYAGNPEHPPLIKLIYGGAVLALGEKADWQSALQASRGLSALFGVLAVLLLAGIDPLAGGLLALHTLAVKYTSQAYLEALPLFASIASVLALVRSRSARDGWFWLSAGLLGLAAAGKYSYFPIVFVTLYLLIFDKRRRWQDCLAYFAVAAALFWALNPYLWHDPVRRLADSILFHPQYAAGAHVQEVAYPWYQPLAWLSFSWGASWHPEVFFYFGFDGLIFLAAVIGLIREWRARRWVVVWIALPLIALLLYGTKWPQYTLVLIPAVCLSAASTVAAGWRWLKEQLDIWPVLGELLPRPSRAFWVVLGIIALAFLSLYVSAAIQIAQGRRGWSHFTPDNSPLPSQTVHDIEALRDGHMALGTDRGTAIWTPPANRGSGGSWIIFTSENSDLPDDVVHAVAGGSAGTLWFGTERGLARYDGTSWRILRASELGLSGDSVRALAFDSDGSLWVGTESGAALLKGDTWTALTSANSGLMNDFILSLAVAPRAEGDEVWFGTVKGISVLHTATGEWQGFSAQNSMLGGDGVADLMVDAAGRVWAATQGGGLSVWDGRGWQTYYSGNSGLSFNTVAAVFQDSRGAVWAGTAFPTEVGGELSSLRDGEWRSYTPLKSGYSGAEVTAIAEDAAGRLWFGTTTAGVDVYEPQN